MNSKGWIICAGWAIAACGGSSMEPSSSPMAAVVAPAAAGAGASTMLSNGAANAAQTPPSMSPVIGAKPTLPSSMQPAVPMKMMSAAAGAGASTGAAPMTMPSMMQAPGAAGMPAMMMAPSTPAMAAGPNDGDPSKPVVALTEVACKQGGGPGFGSAANFKVDDRDVIIDYPCGKHEGAPMTFILNLHGTTPVNQHFYQEGYFSAFKYVGSHNLIIATPSSVVEQWGNGDDGKDLPYLMHVIDWVYQNLGTKFDIRSMWVGGHSWGAFYTSQFGCRAELADKVRGLIIMSGSPTQPACASKMSVIDTNAEMDIGPPLEQGQIPTQHGCKAPMMSMLGNNTQTLWPDCMPGFVHSNYLMLGKMHIDYMDDEVVKSIVDLINKARP